MTPITTDHNLPFQPTNRAPEGELAKSWKFEDITTQINQLKRWAKILKRDVKALSLAFRDERCPRTAKLVAALTVAYALSPIDLIPDCIPVLGLLDDVIIVPAGIMLSQKLMPKQLMEECRQKAESQNKPDKNWVMGAIFIALWAITFYKMAQKLHPF